MTSVRFNDELGPYDYSYACGHRVQFRSYADHDRNGQRCPVCAVDPDRPVIDVLAWGLFRFHAGNQAAGCTIPQVYQDRARQHLDDLRAAGFDVVRSKP